MNTHSFVCDKLVREKLDWWMGVTRCDQGVFCMCMHKLGESRVDKAYALRFRLLGMVSIAKSKSFCNTFSENEAIHYRGHTRR